MALNEPKLIFKQLKGFQAIDEHGKIKTILFLNASREIVSLIGKLLRHFFSKYLKFLIKNMNNKLKNNNCR